MDIVFQEIRPEAGFKTGVSVEENLGGARTVERLPVENCPMNTPEVRSPSRVIFIEQEVHQKKMLSALHSAHNKPSNQDTLFTSVLLLIVPCPHRAHNVNINDFLNTQATDGPSVHVLYNSRAKKAKIMNG